MMRLNDHWSGCVLAAACAVAAATFVAHADDRDDDRGEGGRVKKVFVIAMENHNWTQPVPFPDPTQFPQQIFQNPDAPFINSLVNGTSGISDQVAYAIGYINAGVGVHPSEPNYIWAEAGDNLGVFNDDQPYHTDCSADTVQATDRHLSAFLTRAHRSWKSYQEDTDVDLTSNTVLPINRWFTPLFNLSGTFSVTGSYNASNYANQYNYAAKHNPMVYFADTSGGCDAKSANPTLNSMRLHYAPLQQLALDLQNNTVADYSWITPNQYNDQHSNLATGYGGHGSKDDRSAVAQGDNFLARVVPLIMASKAYKDHGLIVLWWDESEASSTTDVTRDDANHTLPFVIISTAAHDNVDGRPFAGGQTYSHSSTLRTMQQIFDVDPDEGYPWLGGAATATDLRQLFKPGAIK